MTPRSYLYSKENFFHGAVMTFQFFQLILRDFIIAFTIPVAPLTNEPKTSNNERINHHVLSLVIFIFFRLFLLLYFHINFYFAAFRLNSCSSSSLSKN